jgi:hypothetical protein
MTDACRTRIRRPNSRIPHVDVRIVDMWRQHIRHSIFPIRSTSISLLKKGDRHLTTIVFRGVHTVGLEPVPLIQHLPWNRVMQRTFLVLFLMGLQLGAIGLGDAMAGYYDHTLGIVPVPIASGAAWASINALDDGSLGVVYAKARSTPVGGPNVGLQWIRSIDGGLHWSQPVTFAERLGVNGSMYDDWLDPNGGSLLGHTVYEARNQSFGQLPGGRIVCSMANLDAYYDNSGTPVDQSPGAMRRYTGMSYCYSDDYGQTWSPVQSMSPGPFGGQHNPEKYMAASPHGEIVTLSDGTSLMSVYGSRDPAYSGPLEIPSGTTYMAGVLRSTDNGMTWEDPSLISWKSEGAPYEETSLCIVPGTDQLLAAQRTQAGNTVLYESDDLGRTWQYQGDLTGYQQHPADIFPLADGSLMTTWGDRGAQVAMGRSSLGGDDVLLGPTSCFNSGYANGAQAGDGSIVVLYYDMPGSWYTSSVYAVRFTEGQFLAAAGVQTPEPSSLALTTIALLGLFGYFWQRRK